MSGGFSLNVFTDDELNEIHLATLEVLEKTGLFVEDEEALTFLEIMERRSIRKEKIAKLPPYLVEDAFAQHLQSSSFTAATPRMMWC